MEASALQRGTRPEQYRCRRFGNFQHRLFKSVQFPFLSALISFLFPSSILLVPFFSLSLRFISHRLLVLDLPSLSAGPLSCSTGTALLHRRGLRHCQKANDGYFIPLVLGSDVHPQAYAGHYVAFPMCMHDYGTLRIIDIDR